LTTPSYCPVWSILDEWRSSGEGEIGIQVVSLFIPQRAPGPNAAGYECIKNARFAYTFRFGGQHFNTTVWVFDPKKPKMGVRSNRCGFQEYEAVEYLDNDKR